MEFTDQSFSSKEDYDAKEDYDEYYHQKLQDLSNKINASIKSEFGLIKSELGKNKTLLMSEIRSEFNKSIEDLRSINLFYIRKEFEKEYGSEVWNNIPNAEEIFKEYCKNNYHTHKS